MKLLVMISALVSCVTLSARELNSNTLWDQSRTYVLFIVLDLEPCTAACEDTKAAIREVTRSGQRIEAEWAPLHNDFGQHMGFRASSPGFFVESDTGHFECRNFIVGNFQAWELELLAEKARQCGQRLINRRKDHGR